MTPMAAIAVGTTQAGRLRGLEGSAAGAGTSNAGASGWASVSGSNAAGTTGRVTIPSTWGLADMGVLLSNPKMAGDAAKGSPKAGSQALSAWCRNRFQKALRRGFKVGPVR